MKKVLLFLLIFTFQFSLFNSMAQAPQAIPYQAVARDLAGNPIASQTISIQFSVHDGSSVGPVVYRETHAPMTNALGLFSVNLGQGAPSLGTFSSIDFGGGSKYLQVEMDPLGGVTYVNMGTQQMLSVPYALNAGNGNWTKTGNDISNSNIGNVGIGTTSPSTQLHTTGGVRHQSLSGTGLRPVLADDNGNLVLGIDPPPTAASPNQPFFGFCPGITSTITVSGLPTSVPSSSISVVVNITSLNMDDVELVLTAPNGDNLVLKTIFNGTPGPNFTNTVFTDAGVSLSTGTSPWTGSFQPDGIPISFCAFLPQTVSTFGAMGGGTINPNGNWTLNAASFGGATLLNWSVDILPIGGVAGVNNYLPKWEGGTLSSTSNVFDNGSNVGIGTSTPEKKLDVNGYTRIKDHFIFNNVGGVINYGAGAPLRVRTNSTIGDETTYTERMTLTDDSKLGIGTYDPYAKLHLHNSDAPLNTVSADLLLSRYWNGSSDTRASSIFHYFNNTTFNDNLAFGVSGDGGSYDAPNSLSQIKMLIQADGNVGIGTTSPAAKLDVAGDIKAATTVTVAGLNTAGIVTNNASGLLGTSPTLLAAQFPALTGDVTTSAGSVTTTLSNSGVAAGTYTKVTVDAKGRTTSGSTAQTLQTIPLFRSTTTTLASNAGSGGGIATVGPNAVSFSLTAGSNPNTSVFSNQLLLSSHVYVAPTAKTLNNLTITGWIQSNISTAGSVSVYVEKYSPGLSGYTLVTTTGFAPSANLGSQTTNISVSTNANIIGINCGNVSMAAGDIIVIYIQNNSGFTNGFYFNGNMTFTTDAQ